ncbi:MAG TPA: carbohydrate ABC transporter permease [Ignisphaera sp.]|nr:carbohydrate ABC transporter permease [Ignisphaera sp.]
MSYARYVVSRLILYGLAIVAAMWVLIPLILTLLWAFGSTKDLYDIHKIVPTSFTLENLYEIFMVLESWRAVVNSVIVAMIAIAISLALGLPAGYAFARYVFRGRDTLKLLIIATRMFPLTVAAVPLVVLYLKIGLSDTLLGIALAHAAMILPFTIIITSSIFVGVPRDYEEAGLIFGLTRLGAFLRITLPLAAPGIAAAAMIGFIMSWNEVFAASILCLKTECRTLPAHVLTMVAARGAVPLNYFFAASLIMIVPTLLFVLIARRYLISAWGITLR